MSSTDTTGTSAATGKPVTVLVESAGFESEEFASGVVPTLEADGIGFGILQYDAAYYTYRTTNGQDDVTQFAANYTSAGSGITEGSEYSGLSQAEVELTNTSGSTIDVAAQGALFTATDGATYETIEDVTNAAWSNGTSQTGAGYYTLAPGATITVTVQGTFEGDDVNSDAAGSITTSSIAGLKVTQPDATAAGGDWTDPETSSASTWFSTQFGDYTFVFQEQGLAPAETYANVDANQSWTPLAVESWDGYVDHARSVGILSVAPLESSAVPNEDPSQPFATSAWYAGIAQAALYGGGIEIEQPSYYWFAESPSEQQSVIEEIRWANANGIRSSLLIASNMDIQGDADPNFTADTLSMLNILKQEGALPSQIIIDNEYMNPSVGLSFDADTSDVNSLNAAAIAANDSFTFTPSNSEAGLEVTGTNTAQTTLIMSQVDPSVDVAVTNEGRFAPYEAAHIYADDPTEVLTLSVTDTTGRLALSDSDTDVSAAAGGTLIFTGTAADASVFLEDLTASTTFSFGVASMVLTLTDSAGSVTQGDTAIYLGNVHPTVTLVSESGVLAADGSGKTLDFKLSASSRVTVDTSGGVPALLLTNGAFATYAGTDASGDLVFSYKPTASDDLATLRVRGLRLDGASITDSSSGLALDPDSIDAPEEAMLVSTGAPLAKPTVSSITALPNHTEELSGTGVAGSTVTISDKASGSLATSLVASDGTWSSTFTLTSSTTVSVALSDGEDDYSPIASAALTVFSQAGNDVALPSAFSSLAETFASSTAAFYTQTTGQLLVAGNNLGAIQVTGAAGSSAVTVGDGSTLSYSGSGDATILAGNGNDTVLAGVGNDTIALGSGSNDIFLGTGNSLVYAQGTDSIVAGSGVDTVNISGSSTSVYGGYGSSGYSGLSLLVNDRSGTNSIIFAATRGSQVEGSNNTDTTVVAFGDTTVAGGTQGDHLYAGNGAVIAVTGSASGNILVANDGRYANGNFVKLDGSADTGGNQFWAGSGNSTLVGGTGADTLVAGNGSVTVTGGAGAGNDFDFFSSEGGGSAIITDFAATSANRLILFGYGEAGVSQALSSATQEGSSTVFSLSDGTSVTLQSFSKGNLTASMFLATNS